MKNTTNNPKIGNELIQLIRIWKSIRNKWPLWVKVYEPWHEVSNNVVCATSKASAQPAQKLSLIRAFASRLNIQWLLSYLLNTIWSF